MNNILHIHSLSQKKKFFQKIKDLTDTTNTLKSIPSTDASLTPTTRFLLKEQSQDNKESSSKVGVTHSQSEDTRKLQSLQTIDIIHLFLQELHQNEQYRQKIVQSQLHSKAMQGEINELKDLLQSKRAAIRKLCQTETNNLNLIEYLQQQHKKRQFSWDSHFKIKYQQLQACMSQYISNTNEAQEEITRSYKLVKMENQNLLQINEQNQRNHQQEKRLLKLTQIRLAKCLQSLNLLQQKQRSSMIQLQQLKTQNASLNKEVEQLREKIRTNQEQFQIEICKQNKQTSSQLDFIRQKLNANYKSSNSVQKIGMQNVIKQREQLIVLLSNAINYNQSILKQKEQVQVRYTKLIQQLQEKNQLLQSIHQRMLMMNQHQNSSKSQSISNNSRFDASRGEFSRIEPNSSLIDTSSFTEKLLVATNNNYQYDNLF